MKNRKAKRAGLIPYYIDNSEIYFMLMKPSDSRYGGEQFQLAKGKVENGEDSYSAAYREANEELGLLRRNMKEQEYLGCFLGYTEVYYSEIINKNDFTDTTDETSETTWMTLDEFLVYGRGIHKRIFKEFIQKVKLI